MLSTQNSSLFNKYNIYIQENKPRNAKKLAACYICQIFAVPAIIVQKVDGNALSLR